MLNPIFIQVHIKYVTHRWPPRYSKRSAFESLNTVKQGVKPDQTIICLLDCGNDDYCDKCDGICKPTAS